MRSQINLLEAKSSQKAFKNLADNQQTLKKLHIHKMKTLTKSLVRGESSCTANATYPKLRTKVSLASLLSFFLLLRVLPSKTFDAIVEKREQIVLTWRASCVPPTRFIVKNNFYFPENFFLKLITLELIGD